jgi:hypothetical protein
MVDSLEQVDGATEDEYLSLLAREVEAEKELDREVRQMMEVDNDV